jgi:hypothetical protein
MLRNVFGRGGSSRHRRHRITGRRVGRPRWPGHRGARDAHPLQETAKRLLLFVVEGADGVVGHTLGVEGGGVQVASTGPGQMQERDPAVGGMGTPGDQPPSFERVDHVRDGAGRQAKDVAHLAHGAIGAGQGPEQLEARERQAVRPQRDVGCGPDPMGGEDERVDGFAAGVGPSEIDGRRPSRLTTHNPEYTHYLGTLGIGVGR